MNILTEIGEVFPQVSVILVPTQSCKPAPSTTLTKTTVIKTVLMEGMTTACIATDWEEIMEPSKMSKPGQHTGVQRTESQRKLMSTDTQNFSVGSTVSFHNISYKVKRKSGLLFRRKIVMRQILDNVNGIMRPGLNAILGPTGCGKSS
ncbi:hypothetical protein NDU88_006359 [Pleurodeles waltl]|uniref:Uncharacterized protein n=1 Tax=Pleurodeles waltl TaxID=8319 RepID=A0AAV7X0I9_PLEWA|nr:hypothetical protein NDU88_006359 [Pleurodeles waltl]